VTDFLPKIEPSRTRKPEPDLGPTVSIRWIKQGSEEEIFLYNILVQMACTAVGA
jgi:hypothetical protein